VEGIIQVLDQLLQQSKSTEYAYLCHPGVQHVSKLAKEGEANLRVYSWESLSPMLTFLEAASAATATFK
jgi:hypothetical protein